MKKIIYLLIALPFLLFNCKKKEEIDLSQYKASGYLLGVPWQASKVDFTLAHNNTLWFDVFKYNEFKELRELIGFQNLKVVNDTIFLKNSKKNGTGVIDSIVPTANFTTFIADGDLFGDLYDFLDDGTFKSWILLKKVSENEVSAKFQVAFQIKERLYPFKKTLPDSIYFTKGEFLARRR